MLEQERELPETLEIIDEDISTPRTTLHYPYIQLTEVKEVLGLIVPLLHPGEIQILLTINDNTREVGSVEKSVLEMSKLARVCKFDFVVSHNTRYNITKTVDLLEMPKDVWMQ